VQPNLKKAGLAPAFFGALLARAVVDQCHLLPFHERGNAS
jgi:hypothetical protein